MLSTKNDSVPRPLLGDSGGLPGGISRALRESSPMNPKQVISKLFVTNNCSDWIKSPTAKARSKCEPLFLISPGAIYMAIILV